MTKYAVTFKFAKEAGLDQTTVSTTFVDDLDDAQREQMLINAGAVVRVQDRLRKGHIAVNELEGKEFPMSRLFAKVQRVIALTPETAKPVLKAQLTKMGSVDKVFYLIECGLLNLDGAQKMLDHQLEKAEITENEHMAACDRLTEIDD